MAETIDWGNEVIFRLSSSITHNQLVQHCVIRISKEYRLDVSIVYTNMLHTILFLIATSKFMLLNIAFHIVVHISANYQSVLSLTVHGLSVDVVMLGSILHQPPLILELLEVLCSLLIHTRIILRCAYREVDLRFDNVIEAFLIITSLCPRLFAIKHVIRTALYLLHKIFWGANTLKWFNNSHD